MKDQELFDLCKKVYELTKWETKDLYWLVTRGGQSSIWKWVNAKEFSDRVPVYNSDYLLEELPKSIGAYGLEMWSYPSGDGVAFGYYDTLNRRWHHKIPQRGDKLPLKALLKLTIALSEDGQL